MPFVLAANTPRMFYRGAGRIARFRGMAPPPDPYHPEDWVASTTSRFGAAPAGLSTLPDGRLLADAIAADPAWWLGPAHLAVHGADPARRRRALPGRRPPRDRPRHPARRGPGTHRPVGPARMGRLPPRRARPPRPGLRPGPDLRGPLRLGPRPARRPTPVAAGRT